MNNDKLMITPRTIIYDLLNAYPGIEDALIEAAPVFIKLKNPVLRKTITRVTTLKQASVIGNIDLGLLINKLRKAAGQEELFAEKEFPLKDSAEEWIINSEPVKTYDARIDLEKGLHPLAVVMQDIKTLNAGDLYLLITPFIPAPLIDAVRKKGFKTKTEQNSAEVKTYICKD